MTLSNSTIMKVFLFKMIPMIKYHRIKNFLILSEIDQISYFSVLNRIQILALYRYLQSYCKIQLSNVTISIM